MLIRLSVPLDGTGGNAVDTDIILSDLHGKRLGHADHSRLRRGIIHALFQAANSGDGGNVDDLPVLLLDHRRKHRLCAMHGALQVGVDDKIKGRGFRIHKIGQLLLAQQLCASPRVVDQIIDLPETGNRLRNVCKDLLSVPHVAYRGNRANAQGADLLCGLLSVFFIIIQYEHVCSVFCKGKRDLFSHVFPRPGNHGGTSFKLLHSPLLINFFGRYPQWFSWNADRAVPQTFDLHNAPRKKQCARREAD